MTGAMTGKPKAGASRRSGVREYFESICIAVILALFVRTFVFQAFKIPTGSMQENLLIGDHLLVNKMLYHAGGVGLDPSRPVERGDVVVFKFPEEPERDFIKRVVGLPGETLEVGRRQVLVDGRPLAEDYTTFVHGGQPGMRKYRVPEDHYFVMGDNRDNSHDSRFWGALPAENVKGRGLFIYWSYGAPREEYLETRLSRRFLDLLLLPVRFFSRTRWDRFFTPVS